jgi:hypothetical protein
MKQTWGMTRLLAPAAALLVMLVIAGCGNAPDELANLDELPAAEAQLLDQASARQISQDGRVLAAWSGASHIAIRDLSSGRTTRVGIPGSARRPLYDADEDPTVSANGRIVAFSALTRENCYLFVHDRRTGETRRTARTQGHEDGHTCYLVQSVADTGTVLYLHSINNYPRPASEPKFTVAPEGRPDNHQVFRHKPDGIYVTLSADGRFVLEPTGDRVQLRDLSSGRVQPYPYGKLMRFSNGAGLVVSPNGRYLAAYGSVNDLQTGDRTTPPWSDQPSFSADSRLVAYQVREDDYQVPDTPTVSRSTAHVVEITGDDDIYEVRQADGYASRPVILAGDRLAVEIKGTSYAKDLTAPD